MEEKWQTGAARHKNNSSHKATVMRTIRRVHSAGGGVLPPCPHLREAFVFSVRDPVFIVAPAESRLILSAEGSMSLPAPEEGTIPLCAT